MKRRELKAENICWRRLGKLIFFFCVVPPPKRRAFTLQNLLQPSEAVPFGTSEWPSLEGALPAQTPPPPRGTEGEGERQGKGVL